MVRVRVRVCPFCGRRFYSSHYLSWGEFVKGFKSHVIRCPCNPDRVHGYDSTVIRKRAVVLARFIQDNGWGFFKAKYAFDLFEFDDKLKCYNAKLIHAIRLLKDEGVLRRFNSCIWQVDRERLEVFLKNHQDVDDVGVGDDECLVVA